jgi:dGTPase
MRKIIIKDVQKHSQDIERKILSKFATKSSDALRQTPEGLDVRTSFSRDTDRILHSICYTRYIDKTQVFYLLDNDDITHRVLHVQFVSKIARTIGRALRLNEDLIEAISLGHDVGHPPFAHEGEHYLDELCCQYKIKHFVHSVQSVTFLDKIERREIKPAQELKPLNLTLQVLDGILCHDGEASSEFLIPQRKKNWAAHYDERRKKMLNKGEALIPMTLEGCVVRFADVISYIGRDIEDAIKVNLIDRRDLPQECIRLLGNNNRSIINALVIDLIENSRKVEDKVCYSKRIARILCKLKKFNYRNIYLNNKIKKESAKIKVLYGHLFKELLSDIKNKNSKSEIFTQWIDIKDAKYIHGCKPAEIVRDFISSLTDDYFITLFERKYFPKRFGYEFAKEAK